ncbi:hypothetical protein [Ornithinimicrobium murale]|uniref:hypothetical protein n=1 Tax=Ornithinimicrobium murale TaxID=1050153 RepID=UPI000E0D32B2|nr:hypothetical protein [Ornithinimicrobium murale]
MATYAANTKVDSGSTRTAIEKTITRYGASSFAYGWDGTRAVIGFHMNNRQVRFVVPMPDRNDTEFTRTPTDLVRSPAAATRAFEQATRQRWRALLLVLKAKLEAVESGIVTFEEEFGQYVVLPDNRTVAEHTTPAIEAAYATGKIRPLLALGE